MHKLTVNIVFGFAFLLISFCFASITSAATPFYNAYTTLNNSRFSYLGTLSGAYPDGSSVFTIKTTGTIADIDTNNLFPNDVVCLKSSTEDGCTNRETYSISSINSSITLRTGNVVAGTLNDGDNVVASQTARMTVTFVPRSAVPANGKVVVTIQGSGSSTTNADGIPDNNGYDAGDLTNANIGANVGSTAGFTYSDIALDSSSGNHVITLTTPGIGIGTTCSFTIGSVTTAAHRFINPSPKSSHITRGVSDSYGVTIETQDSSSNILDETILKVIPNDGVLVSANVEMSLSYTIAGVGTGITSCNSPNSITTTATAVPFNSITAFYIFYDAAQSHTVSTNANSGYTLTVQQDTSLTDSLGTGATIPETVCDSGPCTSTTPAPWTNPLLEKGFGYSLDHISGTSDSTFTYASGYKPLSTSPENILSRTSATDVSSVYTCYRLAVSNVQPIGYYFNKLTYIATPKF